MLGQGAFCSVSEITAITLTLTQDDVTVCPVSALDHPNPKSETAFDHETIQTDEAGFPVNTFQSTEEIRNFMSEFCLRADDEGTHSRYALKQLKPTNDRKKLEQGMIDLAIEAKFLSCINHPNIIKMRGVAGEPCSPDFSLVLDRLCITLQEQMELWTADKKIATLSRRGICGCFFGTVDVSAIARLVFLAITVAYDLACALRYIHSCG